MKKVILTLTVFFISIRFALCTPPIEIGNIDGNPNDSASVYTTLETDNRIEQLNTRLTEKINAVKQFAKELEDLAKLNGFKSFVNKIFPIGAIYITHSNQTPPLHGDGITWEVLPENCAIMTANSHNTGSTSGNKNNRLDIGNTEGHVLTIDEMPAHDHNYKTFDPYDKRWSFEGGGTGIYPITPKTSKTGGNQPHTHSLNIYNQKLMFWRRTA